MKSMSDIFLTVLGMSLTATYCIFAVCLLRVLLRRMPKIFSYVLWSVVAFRLICPITPESSFSLMQNKVSQSAHRIATAGDTTETNFPIQEQSVFGSDLSIPDAPLESTVSESGSESASNAGPGTASKAETMQEMAKANRKPQKALYGWNPIGFCSVIWFMGVSVLCASSLYRYLRLKSRLEKIASETVSEHDDMSNKRFSIRSASAIGTPFVIGILHPVIYLPDRLTPQEYRYCLAHEKMHIQRFDHLLKPFAFFLACVHWFNPFVWLAFHLMSRDMEMSCDESVVNCSKAPTLVERKAYSEILLKLSASVSNPQNYPLSFGEKNASARIKNIMNYKKPRFAVAVILCAVLGLCLAGLFTNPTARNKKQSDNANNAANADHVDNVVDNAASVLEEDKTDSALPSVPMEPFISEEDLPNLLYTAEDSEEYRAKLVQLLKRNLENNYQKRLDAMDQNIRYSEGVLKEQQERISQLQEILAQLQQDQQAPEQEVRSKIEWTEKKLNELKEEARVGSNMVEDSKTRRNNLAESRNEIPNISGEPIQLSTATDYLNRPDINVFLLQNFTAADMDDTEIGGSYQKVLCGNGFYYYNGMICLNYYRADEWNKAKMDLVAGSLYLVPKDEKSDVNHLDSYYIAGNVIREGTLKDQNPESAFQIEEFLKELYALGFDAEEENLRMSD